MRLPQFNFFSLLCLPISAMKLSQFNFFLSPLLLFWHFNCHNLIFSLSSSSYFGNEIAAIQLFFFSLLSPYILVSVGQLGNQAWAKIWATNIFLAMMLLKLLFLSPLFDDIIFLSSLAFSHNFGNDIAKIYLSLYSAK